MTEAEAVREVVRGAGVESLVARAFAEAVRGRLALVTVLAPRVAPERFLDAEEQGDPGSAFGRGEAFLFARGDRVCAGYGALASFEAEGASRFAVIRDRASEILGRLEPVLDPFAPFAPSPRAFGGFAFSPTAGAPPWDGFPAAAFSIPRVTYTHGREGAVLQVAIDPAKDRPDLITSELRRLLARLHRPFRETLLEGRGASMSPTAFERRPEREGWREGVETALGQMRRGELEKVVLARMTEVRFPSAIDVPSLAARLATTDERTLRFVVSRGGAAFLGATPEQLISKARDAFSADALAGSSGPTSVEELFRAKSAHEHGLVVRYLLERLAPHATEILAEVAPSVVRAGHLRHLFTPIRGRTRRGVHVLDLAAAIHPTPAVCGVPVEPARAAIARLEDVPRGWYAGAIGWFDADGDGELSVALRSGLVRGSSAFLYAGAGIVEGSRADEEWAEVGMKERIMLRALGAEP